MISVVLFSMGGPDKLDSVEKFLFNIFYDVLNLPKPFRMIMAKLISKYRKKKVMNNYALIGGKSPLLENTMKQKYALEKILDNKKYKVHVCMTFWDPMPDKIVAELLKNKPNQVILLPLYPQYTKTLFNAFLQKWGSKFSDITKPVCCYFSEKKFIKALVNIFENEYVKAAKKAKPYVIFIAHGLPERVIKEGDPYKKQVEATVAEILKNTKIKDIESIIAYQSRVGFFWTKPYAEDVILRESKKLRNLLVMPVTFVSEHIETLFELDIEYKGLAMKNGAIGYHRAPTVQDNPLFIGALKDIIESVSNRKKCFLGNCYLMNER